MSEKKGCENVFKHNFNKVKIFQAWGQERKLSGLFHSAEVKLDG